MRFSIDVGSELELKLYQAVLLYKNDHRNRYMATVHGVAQENGDGSPLLGCSGKNSTGQPVPSCRANSRRLAVLSSCPAPRRGLPSPFSCATPWTVAM